MQIDNPCHDSVFCYLKKLFIKIRCLLLQIPNNHPLLSESSCVASAQSTAFHMFYSSWQPAIGNYVCKQYLMGDLGVYFSAARSTVPSIIHVCLEHSAIMQVSSSHRAGQPTLYLHLGNSIDFEGFLQILGGHCTGGFIYLLESGEPKRLLDASHEVPCPSSESMGSTSSWID